jgi:ribose 5-phosphate isomerase B
MPASWDRNLPAAVASDHGGWKLKALVLELLAKWGWKAEDLGTNGPDSVDYPEFGARVAQGVAAGRYCVGILVCGTGIGMSMTANRFRGVRAALCTSAYMARMARAHNDANVLCLGERVIGVGEAEDILEAFLQGEFEGGRHIRRIQAMEPGSRA